MPDENSQDTSISPQVKQIPEIHLPEESLKNYEITTMAADLKKEPVKIVTPMEPLPPAPSSSSAPALPPVTPPPPATHQPLNPPPQMIFEEDWHTVQGENGKEEKKNVISEMKPAEMQLPEIKPPEIGTSEVKISTPLELDMADQDTPSLRYLFIGFLAVIVLGLGGFGIYWYISYKAVSPPIISQPTPIARAPQFDSPLVAVNKTLPLDLTAVTSPKEFFATLKDALAQVASKAQEGDLVRVYPYKDGKKLTLGQLMTLAKVNPTGIEAYIEGDSYTFFYKQATSTQITFGLVVKVTDANNLKNNLQDLEKSALAQSPLLYKNYKGQGLSDVPSTSGFLDKKYKNIDIRYINFGSPQITFDYALYNDLFLAAGSRETMFTLADRVTLGL